MAPIQKKRKLKHIDNQVEQLSFDPDARQEYLTGFRKRKQQRIQTARDAAVKREREEKVRERRQLREQRKADLEKHVAEFNAELRKQNPDIWQDENSDGSDGEGLEVENEANKELPSEVGEDEEYVDEDKYTTVTVEALDVSGDGIDADDAAKRLNRAGEEAGAETKKKSKTSDDKPRPKKRKFRYETKAERQAVRTKQKAKNHAAKLRRTGRS